MFKKCRVRRPSCREIVKCRLEDNSSLGDGAFLSDLFLSIGIALMNEAIK